MHLHLHLHMHLHMHLHLEPPSPKTEDKMDSSEKQTNIKNADDAVPPAQEIEQTHVLAPEREGLKLKLVFAASQIKTTPEDKDAEANGAEAQVPSISSKLSNETGDVSDDLESGTGRESAEGEAEAGEDAAEAPPHVNDSETKTENSAIAALQNQNKSFPQVLHEILATTECQSILHWLPDGFSFLIVDKQRFSSEILPQYFRGALLNSFIRKLNRWGFRRLKSRSKGEESSFAHKNFVRDMPWLCKKMRCESKPSYHKVPSASADKMKKTTKKMKKAKQQSTATTEASDNKSLATPAPATAGIVVSAKSLPPFLATNGTMDRALFVPAYSRMTVSERKPLPDPHRNPTLPKAPPAAPARFLSTATADAATIRETQLQLLAYHQHRIFHERQILIAQMRQRHQLQVELQRLNQMFSQIGEQIASGRAAQRAMMAKYARDMLRSSHNHHRGGRK